MADFLKDSIKVCEPSDVKAIINQLREWSESQRQKFLNKQRIEHRNLFEQSGIRKLEQQINQEYVPENCLGALAKDGKLLGDTSDNNFVGSNTTLQDSSVTGHILGCFSDSSLNSSTFSRRKDEITDTDDIVSSKDFNFSSSASLKTNEDSSSNAAALPPKRPKQPFLKKRSGLLRYFSKQNTNVIKTKTLSSVQDLDSEYQAKPILKLNPAFKINKSPQKISHVKFIEHDSFIPYQEEKFSNTGESFSTLDEEKSIDVDSSEGHSNALRNEHSEDKENNYESEKEELAEFELLENCAQNSSFNSDSSIVQRVLQGESIQPLHQITRARSPVYPRFDFHNSKKLGIEEIPVNSEMLNLGEFLEEQKKQHLQDIILDTDLRIASLKKETSNLNKDVYAEETCVRERCSTPVDISNKVDDQLTTIEPNSESSSDSLSSVVFNPARDLMTKSDKHNSQENGNNFHFQNSKYSICKPSDEETGVSDIKSKLSQKMEELEKEIQTYETLNSELIKEKQTYKEHNLRLASIRAERDENLEKLQKGWDELQKYKEEEEKKLKDERRQLKMREETYNRYQKLRKDNPNRKEREELTVLRQEVEKLQEELKRQRIRFTNDNKRLKNQLIAAEQERDSLKLENITLEEQCQDLLATLKSRHIKRRPETEKKITTKKKETPKVKKQLDSIDSPASSEIVTEKSEDLPNKEKADVNCFKPRVRFNLVPQFDNGQVKPLQSNLQTNGYDVNIIDNTSSKDKEVVTETPTANESNSEELPYKEIKDDNQIERFYFSGEKEIIRPSGIVKHISADGKTVTYRYPNGDVKEVYPDSSVICKFISGVIEKRFPGGIKVTEHPNGQIEKLSPGLEEVKFPDGSTQTRYVFPDGSEKIEYNNGTKVTIEQDGTEIAQFKNGVKEIRTAKYLRKEYPNGSIKIIYENGSQETRYSNGRVKKKDKDGRILLDTKILQNELNFPFQGTKVS